MQRKIIVVGDSPACGGAVLPYESSPTMKILNHRVALMGGRVFCAGCNSVGHIAKAGGSYRPTLCGSEQVLEGDVVVCGCPVSPMLVSSKQSMASCEDRNGKDGQFCASVIPSGWYQADVRALTNSKKTVEEFAKYPAPHDQSERFCPDMTDEDFLNLMMKLRDRAVHLSRRKLRQLESWDSDARASVVLWFGPVDESIRTYLQRGFAGCVKILEGLERKNFARYSEALVHQLGCVANGVTEDVATVCRTDVKTHTLMFKPEFCMLRPDSGRVDSKVATLIHEATHFDDAFSADDLVYGFDLSLDLAKTDPAAARRNSDNFAGYAVWETNHNI